MTETRAEYRTKGDAMVLLRRQNLLDTLKHFCQAQVNDEILSSIDVQIVTEELHNWTIWRLRDPSGSLTAPPGG